jgi:cysteinyl-tRNA synthetase
LGVRRSREYHPELASLNGSFHDDMQALECSHRLSVDAVLNMIVAYIATIVERLAYESNGSVYFNVSAFERRPVCIANWNRNEFNAQLLAEGEGKLTQDSFCDKQSPPRFCTLEKIQVNEPNFRSPLGPGRGWHIECSAWQYGCFRKKLAGTKTMDTFTRAALISNSPPTAEMAQAEAECGCKQWVNYCPRRTLAY